MADDVTTPAPSFAPLAGIRVVELGNFIAAPSAGRILGDFGAEVIKIERPVIGDELRTWRLHAGTTSMLFRTINRNKKSMTLDLRTELGREVIKDLVRETDVLLENFRPGTLEKWGIGPDVLNEINPRLIIVRVSAFGQTGPLSARPGFAAVAEAMSGFRDLVGEPDRPPSRVGVSIGDSIAGLYAALGAMFALFEREVTAGSVRPGPSLDHRVIDVALNEAMFSMMESLIPDYDAFGVKRVRTGGRMEGIGPSNAYLCSDGASVVIAGNGDAIFRRYMEVIGRLDLADDPDLSDNAKRWARRDELDDAIAAWTGQHTAEHVLAELEAAGVPAGPIFTAGDIVDSEQYAARSMIQRLHVSTGETIMPDVAFPGIVPVVGGTSLPIRSLGPELGEHTEEILTGVLGYSPGRVDEITGVQQTA